MSGPTKRELERRVEDLGADADPDSAWAGEDIPRELWGKPAEVWQYDLTEGESHPHLPSPDELRGRTEE